MIHTFLVDPTEEARAAMARGLGDVAWVGHDSLSQLAQSIDVGSLPAVVLVGPGVVHDDAIVLSQSIHDEQLPVEVIQFTKALDPDHLRDALRAGVSDVIEVGAEPDEIREAVTRALRRLQAHVAPRARTDTTTATPIVAVVAGKGGVGASLVTTNLATAMARTGVQVGLVDLDVRSGDLAIMLQAPASLGLLDAVDRVDHLDDEALDGYVVSGGRNLQLLPAPRDGGDAHVPTAPFLQVLDLLGDRVDVLVVDVGDPYDATGRAVLAEASEILVITNREVTAVRGARRVLLELGVVAGPGATVRLVLNESDVATGLGVPDLEKALKVDVSTSIPTDKAGARSVNEGDPLVNRRRSRSGRVLVALADELIASLGLGDD